MNSLSRVHARDSSAERPETWGPRSRPGGQRMSLKLIEKRAEYAYFAGVSGKFRSDY